MKNTPSRKVKILHLISGDLWAGAEVMTFNLLNALKNYPTLDILVVLLNQGKLANELKAIGLNVQIIDERQNSFWQIFQKTRAIIRDHRPEIIHSHRYKENLLALLLSKSRSRKIRLIATQHGLPETTGRRSSFASRCKLSINYFLLSRYFHKTITVSDDIRNTLVSSFKFSDDRVMVIHNGIQLPPATFLVKDKDRPFIIGSSGRLFPVKDYPLMIEIAHSIQSTENVDIRFELAGEGPERPALEAMIQRYGLHDRFFLRGHQEDMASYYQGLNIYINTSLHEGIPMAILEAMSHGLPVIAPDAGGIKEIFNNANAGFLIASRNPRDYAKNCLLLQRDNPLRERMSEAARKRVEQFFSSEKMAENYFRIYIQTLLPNSHS